MAKYTQEDRSFSVATTLGRDELLFHRMTGEEILGRPFRFELELLSEDPAIAFEDVLGQVMTVTCSLPTGGERFFSGHVANFSQVGMVGELFHYQATLRPWLWLLTRATDCRIFQDMTAPDIVKQVFRDQGFSDFEDKLSGSYRMRGYCVQYRESAFNFVSRLMEEEGIYYYFLHDDKKHSLVLSDDYASHGPFPEYDAVPYYAPGKYVDRPDHVDSWKISGKVQSGAYELDAYDFEKPKADLTTKTQVTRSHAHSDMGVYDYPGLYDDPGDGDHYVRCRLEELQAAHAVVRGAGPVCGIAAGSLFSLEGYPRGDQNIEYLITSSTVELTNDEYRTTPVTDSVLPFHCRFTAIDVRTPYRPPRLAPKPFVKGPQTAIVVGPSGEEIWTDAHGRVKVQFHWDRYGKSDENSTCWIRVASASAGNGWGIVQLPRIGYEVVVDFLEGDPDQPIITGTVYNGDNKLPYALPDNKTQSGIKTRSTKEGDPTTFNELRFEDKKDEEHIYFHAEKDFERVVENNDTLKVGFDDKDPGDRKTEIFNDQKEVIGNNQALEVGFGGKDKGDRTVKVYNDQTTEIGNNQSLTVKKGNQTVKISAGKSTIEAAQSIELKVGGSSIKIEPAKITIKSVEIAVEGTAKADLKAAMVEANGSAMLTLKGGVVKIN